jgi:hypothetical protein
LLSLAVVVAVDSTLVEVTTVLVAAEGLAVLEHWIFQNYPWEPTLSLLVLAVLVV